MQFICNKLRIRGTDKANTLNDQKYNVNNWYKLKSTVNHRGIRYKMVEFNFNISSIFPEEISIIGNDLIPSGYKGDTNFGFLKQKVSIRLL